MKTRTSWPVLLWTAMSSPSVARAAPERLSREARANEAMCEIFMELLWGWNAEKSQRRVPVRPAIRQGVSRVWCGMTQKHFGILLLALSILLGSPGCGKKKDDDHASVAPDKPASSAPASSSAPSALP